MDALRIERDDDVLRIVLARPETRNAFDAAAIAELAQAFVDVGKARAVVLAGEGPSFCAGADIDECLCQFRDRGRVEGVTRLRSREDDPEDVVLAFDT